MCKHTHYTRLEETLTIHAGKTAENDVRALKAMSEPKEMFYELGVGNTHLKIYHNTI